MIGANVLTHTQLTLLPPVLCWRGLQACMMWIQLPNAHRVRKLLLRQNTGIQIAVS
jgi:hypothetical protein